MLAICVELPPRHCLVAVFTQSLANRLNHARIEYGQASQITSSLGAHANVAVALSAAAVDDLAGSGNAEPLLGGLVGLHFVGH